MLRYKRRGHAHMHACPLTLTRTPTCTHTHTKKKNLYRRQILVLTVCGIYHRETIYLRLFSSLQETGVPSSYIHFYERMLTVTVCFCFRWSLHLCRPLYLFVVCLRGCLRWDWPLTLTRHVAVASHVGSKVQRTVCDMTLWCKQYYLHFHGFMGMLLWVPNSWTYI